MCFLDYAIKYGFMQRKKIIYVITKSNFGGAQKYVYELVTSLNKELFDVSVLLGGEGLLKEKLEKANIKVTSIPDLVRNVSFIKEIKTLWFFIDFFRKEKPDIVHVNSAKAGGLGALAAKIHKLQTKNYKLKTVFTTHGWAFNENRSSFQKFLIKFFSWLTVFLSSKTIAVSNAIKNQMIDWPFVKNKFEIIWNGVKPIEFLEKKEARTRLSELGSESRMFEIPDQVRDDNESGGGDKVAWIGTTAELHPIKGLDVFIDAAKKVCEENKNVKFFVMGEGEEREKLEKQIKELNLEKDFILLGFVKDAPKYLKAFDLFVLSSRSEALSLSILEAGLAEVPIVATKVGGIPEIISDESLGTLVESNNSEKLAEKILESLENKERAKEHAQSLKTRIENQFSFEKMVEKTVKVYV
jgi:glycosyltransferase involved in cell wall biosynthesis